MYSSVSVLSFVLIVSFSLFSPFSFLEMNDHRKNIKLIAQRWQITAWKKFDFYFNCNLYLPMLFPSAQFPFSVKDYRGIIKDNWEHSPAVLLSSHLHPSCGSLDIWSRLPYEESVTMQPFSLTVCVRVCVNGWKTMSDPFHSSFSLLLLLS